MYMIRGYRRKHDELVKEEVRCGPGKLWDFLQDYEAFWVTWKARPDVEPMEEMLESFLRALRERGVEEVCYEKVTANPDEEPAPICVTIESVKGERLSELASRVAVNDIEITTPPGAVKDTICSFSNPTTLNPHVHIWTNEAADFDSRMRWPTEEERTVFCLHVQDGKLILHTAKEPYDREFKHPPGIYGEDPVADLDNYPDLVELEFPESGLQFEVAEMAQLYRIIFSRYNRWLLTTDRYREYKRIREKMKQLNSMDQAALVKIAEKAVEEMRKCEDCREELGERVERIEARKGRWGAVIVYTLTKEEAWKIFKAHQEAIEEAEKWADVVITDRCKTVADAEKETAKEKPETPYLAPVHLNRYWNSVEIYIGHDAHPVYDVAEMIRKHVEWVLRGKGLDYTVERC